jgi:hypothetical protein
MIILNSNVFYFVPWKLLVDIGSGDSGKRRFIYVGLYKADVLLSFCLGSWNLKVDLESLL